MNLKNVHRHTPKTVILSFFNIKLKKLNKDIPMKLWIAVLGAFLVLNGLMEVADLSFKYDNLVSGSLSLAAGALVFLQK